VNIYTRTGDDGTTGLLFGGRVPKDHAAPAACGDVDEAQAALGMARALAATARATPSGRPPAAGPDLAEMVVGLERDLWVLMAELATSPDNRHKLVPGRTLVTAEMVSALETLIDDVTGRFPAPREFVLPGQTPVSAALDVARTVVRRAERTALAAAADGSLTVPYLNRLSDLLWALARWQEGDPLPSRPTTKD
jgi:cob(I)alamin adenosyltransferase